MSKKKRVSKKKHKTAVKKTVSEPVKNKPSKGMIAGIIAASAVVLAALILLIVFLTNNNNEEQTNDTISSAPESSAASESSGSSDTEISSYSPAPLDESKQYYADIEIQNEGTITVALDYKTAPVTTANFVGLANSGFYDGLTFHRIMEGFMMQGGDPKGNGTGGSENTIVGEFSANGYENNISHTRGTISMARNSLSMDSASSQFFIVQKDSTFLDGQYAAFGHVTSGMEIVDKICSEAEPVDDNGSIESSKQPVITSIKIRTEDIEE